jgi:hypothetical protein
MIAVAQRLTGKFALVWAHRTKLLGLAAVGVAYGQSNLAQLGTIIPPKYQGILLGAFGVAAFFIGLYNTLATEA